MGGVGLVEVVVLVVLLVVGERFVGAQLDDFCLRLRLGLGGLGLGGQGCLGNGGRCGSECRFACEVGFGVLGRGLGFGDRDRICDRVAVRACDRCSRFLQRLGQLLGLEGIALDRARLDVHLFGEPGERRVGNDVADVEERRLVQADVDERGLHSREDPDHPALVDVAYDPFLVLALQVVLRNLAFLDQRDPGLLTRGVDHQDVRHRKFLFPRPRGSRATAAGRRSGAARS